MDQGLAGDRNPPPFGVQGQRSNLPAPPGQYDEYFYLRKTVWSFSLVFPIYFFEKLKQSLAFLGSVMLSENI